MLLLLKSLVFLTAVLGTDVVANPISDPLDQSQPQRPFQLSESSSDAILTDNVDAAIDSILQNFKTPGGVGVAVVRKKPDSEWNVETKGYGLAKLDGTKITEETLFGIGSNSKLFDILATGLLISNKSLSPGISWKTKIASIIPEWELMDPIASAETTIVDAMSHRTGLPRHDLIMPAETVSEEIRRLRYLKPSTGFREHWQYNNHMYTVLSYLPPVLTGIPFETYVTDFILRPLGMNSTTYYSKAAAESGHLADGIGRDGVNQTKDIFDMGRARAYPFWAPNEGKPGHVVSGAGGLISSAKDMAVWLQALLNEGQHPSDNLTVIPADVIRQVASGITVAGPVARFPELSPTVYGGGQMRGTYRGFEFIEHGGSVLGFKSQVTRIPSLNFGVSVLSNDEHFGSEIVETVKFRIIDEFLNLEAIDWSERYQSIIADRVKNGPKPTPRSQQPAPPSVPFSDLAGTYTDPGYGSLDLCLISPKSLVDSPSESCSQLIGEIPIQIPSTLDPEVPTLLARWPAFGMTHVSLAHFERNVFNVTAIFSIPTANASDKPYWVQTQSDPSLVAEFALDDSEKASVGLRGFWGAGEGVESPEGDSVKDRAEVWFEKIEAEDQS